MSSVLLGKVSGGGTTTNTFRDVNDSKDRVTAVVVHRPAGAAKRLPSAYELSGAGSGREFPSWDAGR